jgi:hypothetical protein
MAGEWLKFEANTPEKPEVLAITIAMGWDDPDLTVGKLMRVWRWFDQQTVNGNAPSVTAALLDRLLGVSGLCQAMANVGWLVIDDHGLTLPNFDRHNGKTAKDRALTAKRVATHKSNVKGNADIVSDALPREEKRREEVIDTAPSPKSPRGTALPADWTLPDDWKAWAEANRPDVDVQTVAESFRDFWIAKPGKDGRKADWQATWRNWVRNQRAQQHRQAPQQSSIGSFV